MVVEEISDGDALPAPLTRRPSPHESPLEEGQVHEQDNVTSRSNRERTANIARKSKRNAKRNTSSKH